MILPLRLLIIKRESARVKRNVPLRLILRTASQSSSSICISSLSRVMPALLTRMSTKPHFAITASTVAATAAGSATLQMYASASPPAERMNSTVSLSFVSLVPIQATPAPLAARVMAIARPRPRVAPVTRAFCPDKSTVMGDGLSIIEFLSNDSYENY